MLKDEVRSIKINSESIPFLNTGIEAVLNEDGSESIFLDIYVHKTIAAAYDDLNKEVNVEITLNNGSIISGKFYKEASAEGCIPLIGNKEEIQGAEIITSTPFEIWVKQLEQNNNLFNDLDHGEILEAEIFDCADRVCLDDMISFLLQHDIVKDEFNKKLLARFNDSDFVNDSIRQYITKQMLYFLEDLVEKLRKEVQHSIKL
jgi:hypothetical protein